MQVLRLLIPMGIVSLAVGDVIPTPIGEWANLTGAAMLGVATLFLLTKYLPSRDKQLTDQAVTFTSSIVAQAQSFTAVTVEQAKVFTGAMDRLSDRHDRWEQTRHDDQRKLDETIGILGKSCAAHLILLDRVQKEQAPPE